MTQNKVKLLLFLQHSLSYRSSLGMKPGTNDNNNLASSLTSIAYSNCFLQTRRLRF